MEQWKRAILQGNSDFEARQYHLAFRHYRRALMLARHHYASWPVADQAVAALVIAHHNLAELLVRMDHVDDAADNLCAAHDQLLATMADDALPMALREAASCHSKATLCELSRFAREYGSHPRVMRTMSRSCDLCDPRTRTLH